MDATAQMDAWLAEAGESDSSIVEVRASGAEPRWGVEYDDALQVLLEFDPPTEALSFSSSLGSAPVGQESAMNALALQANGLREVLGGGYLGHIGTEGEFGLFLDLARTPTQASELLDALTQFAERARTWRRVITAGDAGESAASINGTFDALRV
jgi:hypothetical protein